MRFDYWLPFIAELIALQIAGILGSISHPHRENDSFAWFPNQAVLKHHSCRFERQLLRTFVQPLYLQAIDFQSNMFLAKQAPDEPAGAARLRVPANGLLRFSIFPQGNIGIMIDMSR